MFFQEGQQCLLAIWLCNLCLCNCHWYPQRNVHIWRQKLSWLCFCSNNLMFSSYCWFKCCLWESKSCPNLNWKGANISFLKVSILNTMVKFLVSFLLFRQFIFKYWAIVTDLTSSMILYYSIVQKNPLSMRALQCSVC